MEMETESSKGSREEEECNDRIEFHLKLILPEIQTKFNLDSTWNIQILLWLYAPNLKNPFFCRPFHVLNNYNSKPLVNRSKATTPFVTYLIVT